MNPISCIYKITNTKNNKFYFGSTIDFKERKQAHLRNLRNKKHCNEVLQKSYDKYGEEAFVFEIVEIVEDNNVILKREQYYIDLYFDNQKMCYNICRTAGNTLGRKTKEETKLKISKTTKGRQINPNTHKRLLDKDKNPFAKSGNEHPKTGKVMPHSARDTISQKLTGKKRTEEHSRNISKALIGKKMPNEQREKLKDGRRKGTNNARAKKVAQYDLENNLIKIWDYMSLAAKETGTNLATMSQCCYGKQKTANGFIWRLLTLENEESA